MAELKFIKVETRDGIGVLTVNRPDKLNALNAETVAELHRALEQLAEDRSCPRMRP